MFLRSEDFAHGEEHTPENPMVDDHWALPEIGLPILRIHPMHLLDGDDRALLAAHRARRGTRLVMPMPTPSGRVIPVPVGHLPGDLPYAGGVLEQPACVMASLAIMAAAEVALAPRGAE